MAANGTRDSAAVATDRSLLLIRHGETTWNAEGRWQGWADTTLSDRGEQQARDAARQLGGLGLTRVGCSDLTRARRTAELLASGLGLDGDPVVEPDLRERDVGAFSGKTIDELLVEFPDCFEPGTRRALRVPGGETDDALWERVAPAVVRLTDRFPDDTLLLVSHGGVIRTIERHVGVDPGPSLPNLGGRWFSVVDGRLVAGERFVPLDADLVTAPRTE